VGGVGLLAGYIGPLVLNPESNIGPVIGIVFTGPVGMCIGLLLGAFTRSLELSLRAQWYWLLATCAIVLFATLRLAMP